MYILAAILNTSEYSKERAGFFKRSFSSAVRRLFSGRGVRLFENVYLFLCLCSRLQATLSSHQSDQQSVNRRILLRWTFSRRGLPVIAVVAFHLKTILGNRRACCVGLVKGCLFRIVPQFRRMASAAGSDADGLSWTRNIVRSGGKAVQQSCI